MQTLTTESIERLIRDWMVERAAHLLRVPPASLGSDKSLTSLGLDSLAAVSLIGELEEWLHCGIPEATVQEAEDIDGLARVLAARKDVRKSLSERQSGAAQPPVVVVAPERYTGGEDFDLADIIRVSASLRFQDRVRYCAEVLRSATDGGLYRREIASSTGREVVMAAPGRGEGQRVLMFGSNSYLGLANDPHVASRVREVLDQGAIGLGGAPLLSGFTRWHRELEERLAAMKGTEAALLYSTGYSANIGLVTACCSEHAFVICDEYSHASFKDGLKQSRVPYDTFRHNDMARLEALLKRHASHDIDLFVGVEGLYSMDGDVAPLDRIARLCNQYGATLLIDDAHATGVIGPKGHGSTERFDLDGHKPIVMGTLSKALAGIGGFICGSRELVDYLRFLSRPYMFSTSMPPTLVAQALGGLDVMAGEPGRLAGLRRNIKQARAGLQAAGVALHSDPESPILAIMAPAGMNIRAAGRRLQDLGVFVNVVEYPAVPRDQQRFRVSIMSSHTPADIDRMVAAFQSVWPQSAAAEGSRAEEEAPAC